MAGRRARAPAVLRIPDVRVSMRWSNWWKRTDACGTCTRSHERPGHKPRTHWGICRNRNKTSGLEGPRHRPPLPPRPRYCPRAPRRAPCYCPRAPRRGESQEDLRFAQKAVGGEAGQPAIPGVAGSEGWRGPWDPGSKARTHRGICRKRNETCSLDGSRRPLRGSPAPVRNHKETCASCKKRNGAGGFTPTGQREQRNGAGLKALRARRKARRKAQRRPGAVRRRRGDPRGEGDRGGRRRLSPRRPCRHRPRTSSPGSRSSR